MRQNLRLAIAGVLLFAACGGTADVTVEPRAEPAEPRRWRVIDLAGMLSADTGLALAERNGVVVAVTSTDADGFGAWATNLDTGNVGRVALDPAAQFVTVGGVASAPAGFVAIASLATFNDDEPRRIEPWAYVSGDGRAWRSARIDQENADVHGITSAGSGYLAVGTLRVGEDPSGGPFVPVLWRSSDGLAWDRVALPGVEANTYGYLTAVATNGTTVVVGGSTGSGEGNERPRLWTSNDGGATWAAREGPIGVGSIAPIDDTFLAGRQYLEAPDEPPLLELVDGTWRPIVLDAGVLPPGAPAFTVRSNGDVALAAGDVSIDPFGDAAACYEDPHRCNGHPARTLLTRTPAGAWRAVDMPREADADASITDTLVTDAGDALVALSSDRVQLAVWTGGELPAREPVPTTPPPAPPIVEYGATLEVGTTYRYPLYTHCGLPFLDFNEQTWRTDAQLPHEIPPEWPVAQQSILGELTLVVAGRIEYTVPGAGVIATYVPTDETPPGCE